MVTSIPLVPKLNLKVRKDDITKKNWKSDHLFWIWLLAAIPIKRYKRCRCRQVFRASLYILCVKRSSNVLFDQHWRLSHDPEQMRLQASFTIKLPSEDAVVVRPEIFCPVAQFSFLALHHQHIIVFVPFPRTWMAMPILWALPLTRFLPKTMCPKLTSMPIITTHYRRNQRTMSVVTMIVSRWKTMDHSTRLPPILCRAILIWIRTYLINNTSSTMKKGLKITNLYLILY